MRLIIVSNRLPVTVVESPQEGIEIQQSIGGLATGLNSFLRAYTLSQANAQYQWVGWPGIDAPVEKHDQIKERLAKLNCHPVFIPTELSEPFLSGFCNNTLWPLFHHLPAYAGFDSADWQAYQRVNALFSEKIAETVQAGDMLWIHDYHLFLLPGILHQQFPDLKIGFFLHIPFPTHHSLQLLPENCRKALLKGLTGCDLIGFHTEEYLRNFKETFSRQLGELPAEIKLEIRPMGVDFEQIQTTVRTQSPSEYQGQFLSHTENQKLILSVDRLDYTKGITQRLNAYQKFLEECPVWQRKILMVLVVAPSREEVGHYQSTKKQIDELVGKINGKFGDFTWSPIIYIYRTFTQAQLVELYSICDIALITPLKDGMNLIAKEYLAARIDATGVLILSKNAGAAKELSGSIIIDPNSVENIANGIKQAVEMSTTEQKQRMQMMQKGLKINNVTRWGMEFVKSLSTKSPHQEEPETGENKRCQPRF